MKDKIKICHKNTKYGNGIIEDVEIDGLKKILIIRFPKAKLGSPNELRKMNVDLIGDKLFPCENATDKEIAELNEKILLIFQNITALNNKSKITTYKKKDEKLYPFINNFMAIKLAPQVVGASQRLLQG